MNLKFFVRTLITLLAAVVLSCALASAQGISLNMRNATVSRVIAEIQSHYGYSVVVKSSGIDMERRISVSVTDVDVETAVRKVFEGQPVSVSVNGRTVVVSESRVADNKAERPDGRFTLNGTVKSADGEPLIGAGIMVKGRPGAGAVADIDGNFSVDVAMNERLVVSFMGFTDAEVPVIGRTPIDIVLSPDNQFLTETVVVGYGTQKKVNLTGAVAVVDGDNLRNRNAASVGEMLQGAMPNVTVKTSGRAGDETSVNIRGVTSIASSTGPLILVDGVEGDLRDVNPNDIESISVLKDASASAVYGARAGFGVVLVTTKNPSEEKINVSYNGKFTFGTATVSTDFETRGYYSAYINDMFFRTYQGTPYTTYTAEDYHELWIRRNDKVEDPSRPWVVEKGGVYKYYGNFDWYNYMFDNTRPTHDHNLSVSGRAGRVSFLVSGNFYDQTGAKAIKPDRYTHYTFRTKLGVKVTDWLEITNNTNWSSRKQSFPGSSSSFGSYFSNAWKHALASIVPINPDGTYVYYSSTSPTYTVTDGAHAIAEYGKHDMADKNTELRTTFEAVIRPVRQFEIRANYSYTDLLYYAFNRFVDVPYSRIPGKILYMSASSDVAKDRIQESYNTTRRNVFNAYATYGDVFAGKHDFKAMAGVNYEYKYYKNNYMRRYDLLSEEISDFNIAVGDNIYTRGGQNDYAVLGFFYRLNYAYADRYLVETSGRYDGSSRFAKGRRFGFFPSFSLGWRISEEPFFKNAKSVVNNLKLRYSYGSLGNQSAVGYYDYIQTITTSSQLNYRFGEGQKVYYANESDPNASDISWEKIYTNNLGLDLSMFRGRLNFSGDAYIRDTKDMIMQSQALPSTYGAAAPKNNSADLRTYGYEFTVSWNDSFALAGDDFSYGVSFGLGDNVSYVTKYDNPNRTLASPYVGQKLGDIWGYRIGGLFATNADAMAYQVDQSAVNDMINTEIVDNGLHAGDLKFLDLDGNGKIEPTTSADDIKDMVIIGNSLPRYNFSGTVNLGWKGIDFSIMLQGIGRQNMYPSTEDLAFWGPYSRPYTSFIPKDFMSKVWSESNPDAYFPRPRGYVALKSNRELGAVNDRYLQNVGYCRLKNLTIGYTLPKKWLERMRMTKFRIYFSGENLATVTALKSRYIDPEQASSSLSWKNGRGAGMVYPYARTFTFGLDITF